MTMTRMNVKMIYAALVAATLLGDAAAFGVPAYAQTAPASPVKLSSDVKIERTEVDASGVQKQVLYTPKDVAVVPGDTVLFTLLVSNTGTEPAVGFRATNPMPNAVRFASVSEDWADVSVDGGVKWGKLAELKVTAKDAAGTADVERSASAEDVTHVRWIFPDPIAPGSKRTVSYRGVVK